MNTLIPVPFHGYTLFIVEYNGEPYVVMKTIVEALGLDWRSQLRKLNDERERWGMVILHIPSPGGLQPTLCMSLKKFTGWINTLHVNKVGNAVRPKVALFQRESDDALWNYWNKGVAHNPRVHTTMPTMAHAVPFEGVQLLIPHEPEFGLTLAEHVVEMVSDLPRGTIAKLAKRDPILKAECHVAAWDRLAALKPVLGLRPNLNVQRRISLAGGLRVAQLPRCGSVGKHLYRTLAALMPAAPVTARIEREGRPR